MPGIRRTDSGFSHSVIRGLVTDRLMTTPQVLRSNSVDQISDKPENCRHSAIADDLNSPKLPDPPQIPQKICVIYSVNAGLILVSPEPWVRDHIPGSRPQSGSKILDRDRLACYAVPHEGAVAGLISEPPSPRWVQQAKLALSRTADGDV